MSNRGLGQGLRTHSSALQHWVGWYALSRGERLCGVFPSYAAAARALAELFDGSAARISLIEPEEQDVPDGPVSCGTSVVDVRYGWAMGTGGRATPPGPSGRP